MSDTDDGSHGDDRREATKPDARREHPAGPHARPELTNEDATPGAGALPDPEGQTGDAGGTG